LSACDHRTDRQLAKTTKGGGKDSSKMHSDGRINLDWRAG